jgi:dTDP-4-dehydrorhamnose 3,5-epimerase
MKVTKTALDGVLILEPRVFGDNRGYFYEAFNQRTFEEATGVHTLFVQDNESRSSEGVVRGLHFQLPPYAQSKLISVAHGAILDVAVDIRRGSPTFGKYVAIELSDENHRELFIPRGFAHGFAVLSDEAILQYKCDNAYAPGHEGSIAWNDPDLGIDWCIPEECAILSGKDSISPLMRDMESPFDYNEPLY